MGVAPPRAASRVENALRGEGRPLEAPHDFRSWLPGILVFVAVPSRVFCQGLLVRLHGNPKVSLDALLITPIRCVAPDNRGYGETDKPSGIQGGNSNTL